MLYFSGHKIHLKSFHFHENRKRALQCAMYENRTAGIQFSILRLAMRFASSSKNTVVLLRARFRLSAADWLFRQWTSWNALCRISTAARRKWRERGEQTEANPPPSRSDAERGDDRFRPDREWSGCGSSRPERQQWLVLCATLLMRVVVCCIIQKHTDRNERVAVVSFLPCRWTSLQMQGLWFSLVVVGNFTPLCD